MDNIYEFAEKQTESIIQENEARFFKKEDNQQPKFHHNEFAEYIMSKYHVININNRLHVYKDGIYIDDERLVKHAMVTQIPKLRRTQQTEVLEYLRTMAPHKDEEPAHLIPVKNGVYNIKENELISHTPDLIFTARFNVNYDADAKSEIVSETLFTIADEDTEIVEMFTQIFGYLLYKENFIGKSFLFVGSGGNGKSLLLRMMQAMVGTENTSSVSLQALSEQFNVSSLHHKLLNAGDDIPLKSIDDASNFKKLSTGEPVLAAYKGQDVFAFENYAKLVFSANGLPRWYENSNGVFDRLIIVPFNARIRGTSKEDPNLPKKVTTEESKSYLFNIALGGLKKVLKNNGIYLPSAVQTEMDDFRKDNDPLSSFMDSYDIEQKRATDVYEDYRDWSEFEGYKHPLIRKEFKKKIIEKGYTQIKKRIGGYPTSQWCYIHKDKLEE
ncbi:MAG: phage/plasmid primase, P4 family [Staphylococcus equorum]|uniref:DNA primase family protein n=1 Tax=Staphylococcus TaxID=1279 RepID=UPI002554E06C|nr:DNA primase family protein [Staphylococcus equorum]MDK9870463.1 phage/plasmid primase, P4 family [Staphylococcus equorum]MDK9878306.1 phage/plasmid primase, P4 family [Staphylococcus equorum]MDN6570027.1 phage/plasmid primase, P4 family [Staphylococcus equorum]MDN6611596.1 phage/plasmid primase, P4 family [Staphylococcus equorum]MDN6741025.1 phage/plasmid primase, P4 family [Staphylococcus equorum]